MKKLKVAAILITFVGMTAGGIVLSRYLNNGWDGKNDIRIGVVTPEEIGMVVISPGRKMVSILRIDQKVKIWIPGGMGWYQSNRFKKIVEQEKLGNKIDSVFFYNFGFLATNIVDINRFDDWRSNSVLWGQLGGLGGIFRYKMLSDRLIYKEDTITGDLINNEGNLDEIMPRDFADNQLLNDSSRISLINTTTESGLANFVGNRLGWAGFSVVAAENSPEAVENCQLVFGEGAETSEAFKKIKKIFDCQAKKDSGLGNQEIELYLGQKMASVIKYSSYVGTF